MATQPSASVQRAQDRAALGLRVRFINMNDQGCGGAARCETERGGVVLLTDDHHITNTFLRSLGLVLGERGGAAIP